ncbi:DinB family protein [Fulvivirgaceae bacterium BMA12]|uniref:DinB family protein n=1 Tax=Agaribacillus aureus TaxID=3051825 RepID=A0ABT8LED8_9BACT|nr:DinB family protein [Fulvivirgaceae bacterium BMA12]
MSAHNFLAEMEQEFAATKNLLQIIPEDRLTFKPHEKAMALGQLAYHVATIPGRNLMFAKDGAVETSVIVQHPVPDSKHDILNAFEESVRSVRSLLGTDDTSWLTENWKLKKTQKPIAEMPAFSFVRTFVLNHWYHHRGELTTYLRILNQKIPSVYGPSADVDPFA